jgi:hypothetical protein
MSLWIALLLVAGGLFAGGVVTIAWSRSATWNTMRAPEFLTDFERTIRTADKVQPALLLVSLVASVGAVVAGEGTARVAAGIAAVGFVSILVASAVVLVPLQRRLIAAPRDDTDAIVSMRHHWVRGHVGRSVLAVLSYVAAVVASVS